MLSAFLVVYLAFANDAAQAESFRADLQGGRIILSISSEYFNRDMLVWNSGSQHRDQRLVQWRRSEGRVDLVTHPIDTIDGPIVDPGARLRRTNSVGFDVIERFPIVREDDYNVTIDVSELFLEEVPGMPSATSSLPESVVATHAEIDTVKNVQDRIIVSGVFTFSTLALSQSERRLRRFHDVAPITIRTAWNIVVLPDSPMTARAFDPRMGFMKLSTGPHFGTDWLDFTGDPIHRWRLEKQNPQAAVSNPIRPIVFYIDNETPNRWRPWIREGILSWLPAFEAAGFSNAIEVREMSADADPSILWNSEYSFVRWDDWSAERYSESRRGRGRHRGSIGMMFDPRSGEILKADILMGGPNEIARDMYFVRLAPLDARAQRIPFPDAVMGEIYKFIAAHEAGHAFGLVDGNFGEFAYPAELARSQDWLEEMGHTPSIMSYARHNYLVQPEDGIPPELLVQRVGPMDRYSIRWGYSVFDPAEEAERLEEMVREQESLAWYRFNRYSSSLIGPDRTNEVVDNNDPIESTRLGLLNLRRVIELMPAATLHEDGGNALLEHMYFEVLRHWTNLMLHPLSMIGGVTTHQKSGGQPGLIYTPVDASFQRNALLFLNENAFQTPTWLGDDDILLRFEPRGGIANINDVQGRVLGSLLSTRRINALAEFSLPAEGNDDVYSLSEMLRDLRSSIWSEIYRRRVVVDPYRQGLQGTHIRILINHIEQNNSRMEADRLSNYAIVSIVSDLDELKDEIESAIPKASDRISRAHLNRTLDELAASH